MKVYRSLKEIDFHDPCWISVGTFDGIHVGHRAILERLIERSRGENGKSVLVTFEPHPQNVIQSSKPPVSILTPLDEKAELLQTVGVDAALVLTFTEEFARIGPEAFVETLNRFFLIRGMVSGSSHVFGSRRSGNAGILESLGKRFGFSAEVVPPVLIDGEAVSSTSIRDFLLSDHLSKANRFLGRNYSIPGRVIAGERIGTKMGFPTANLRPEHENKLIPRNGVYAVLVRMEEKKAAGTANIGFCPTVGKPERSIEVHLHGWKGDLYDRKIILEFVHRLRDEKKFDTMQALAEQIKQDMVKTQQLLL